MRGPEKDDSILGPSLEALTAPTLEEVNSWLEDLLSLEQASLETQQEFLSLIDMEAHCCLIRSTTRTRDITRLICLKR